MSYEDRIQAEVDAHNEAAEKLQKLQQEAVALEREMLARQGRIQLLQELVQEERAAADES